MNADCTRTKLLFQGLDGRDVVGRFDGGEITSDAGGVLLREVECRDRLLALLCDRDDLTGEFRRRESDRGKPLAGKSTLHRLERTPSQGPEGRYRKIVEDPAKMDALLRTCSWRRMRSLRRR